MVPWYRPIRPNASRMSTALDAGDARQTVRAATKFGTENVRKSAATRAAWTTRTAQARSNVGYGHRPGCDPDRRHGNRLDACGFAAGGCAITPQHRSDHHRRPAVKLLWAMRRPKGDWRPGNRVSPLLASFPLCCPARATWITGQYAHNHGVIDNRARNGGGYPALRHPMNVLSGWLRSAGYETALAGKWLHDYDSTENAPGWEVFTRSLSRALLRLRAH